MIHLEEGENVLKVVRRHYFVLFPLVSFLVLAAIAPIVLVSLLFAGFSSLDEKIVGAVLKFADEWKNFGYSIWLLVLWTVFFMEWTDYYLDLWIITDKRVIDAEQKGFFNREVTSFRFEQIQDITVETKGLIETFFKFGTLHIQTAGHSRDIVIKDACCPENARTLILELQEKSKSTQSR